MKEGNDEDKESKEPPPMPSTSLEPDLRTTSAQVSRRGARRRTAKYLPKSSEIPISYSTTKNCPLTVPTKSRNPAVKYNIANKFGKKKPASRVT